MTNPLIGPELNLNPNGLENQSAPDVATLADGRSVVVWADGLAIKAQFVDATATPSVSGGEFGLATYVPQVTYDGPVTATVTAKVAALSDGGFAVVWQGNEQNPFYGSPLGESRFEQTFNADGTARGAAMLVSRDDASALGGPGGEDLAFDVAALPTGGFGIVSSHFDVFDTLSLQAFDNNGSLLATSGYTNFKDIDRPSAGASIAATTNGDYVVAWMQYTYSNTSVSPGDYGPPTGAQIEVAEFAPNGSTVIAPTTIASMTFAAGQTPGTTDVLTPVVGALANGNVAVAWDNRNGSVDQTDYRILGSTLAPNTGPQAANATTSGSQTSPTLAADGNAFALGWSDTSSGNANVVVREFAASGSPLDSAFVASGSKVGAQTAPSLASRGSTEIALTWQDNDSVTSSGQTSGAGNQSVLFQALLSNDGNGNTTNVGNAPNLTLTENAAATAINLVAPTNPNYSTGQLTITAGALPNDGSVTLANGTAITSGEVLTSAQLTGLLFTPTAGQFNTISAFTYSVSDPTNTAVTGTATLAIGPAVGNPVTKVGALTVASGQAATALNVPSPTDPNYPAARLVATVTALPSDGTIDLADGVTPITLNQVLSAAQLTSLTFVADAGASNVQSSFGYTVADPAQNTTTGTFILAVGPIATPTLSPGNQLTDIANPTLTGTAIAGSLVTLQLNGTPIGTAPANATTGAFSISPTGSLPLGADTLTVTASTSAGTSAASAATKLFVLPDPVNGTVSAGVSTGDIANVLGQGFHLQFTAGTEALQLLNGTLSVGPDTNEAFIQRLYEGLLNRGSDPGGLAINDQALSSGAAQADVATGLLTSPEYQSIHGPQAGMSNLQFVTQLYAGFLNRAPDQSGLQAWDGFLDAGGSRGQVAADFAQSSEAKMHFASATTDLWVPDVSGATVTQLYETGLGRDPDPTGLQNDLAALQSGATVSQLASGIIGSQEFASIFAGQSPTVIVTSFYMDGLGRAPDPGGLQNWTGALQGGASLSSVLVGIGTSPEAATHLSPPV